MQHYFWEYVDPEHPAPGGLDDDVRAALLAVYDELDQAIGRLVDAAGPDANVVLLSDHGFGTKPERSVRVNRWLGTRACCGVMRSGQRAAGSCGRCSPPPGVRATTPSTTSW